MSNSSSVWMDDFDIAKRHHAGMWQLVMSNAIGIGMVCHSNTVSPCVWLTSPENLGWCSATLGPVLADVVQPVIVEVCDAR